MTDFLAWGKIMKRYFSLLFLLCPLMLTQCLSYDLSRKTVQQGNLITAEKVAKLRIGMSKRDVEHLMGSSLIFATFNPNRVDYAYTLQHGAHAMTIKYVTLNFKGDRLVRIEHLP